MTQPRAHPGRVGTYVHRTAQVQPYQVPGAGWPIAVSRVPVARTLADERR